MSEPQSCNVNVSEPYTLASVTVNETHSGNSSVSEPHSGNSSVSEPHTCGVNASEPHNLSVV